jgi:2-polyprenyl-3-methyl-5-hydroxy-6-metoxy-1,4-benzoquinol methylase
MITAYVLLKLTNLEAAMKPLKRIEDYLSAFFKLGKIKRMTKLALTHSHDLRRDVYKQMDSFNDILRVVNIRIDDAIKLDLRDLRDLKARHSELARSYMDLTHRLDHILLAVSGQDTPAAKALLVSETKNDGLSAVKDSFYHRLENQFRGTTDDIKMRLRIYLPEVEAAVLRCTEKPVLDIGCGRGEWLELLSESDLPAFGVDTNPVQIADVMVAGLDARQLDARAALTAQPDNSLSCITAHHLIEHLPFDEVLWITREAMRVLAPGGLLLFETPNVRNILVGATSFHNDPTHLKPMTDPVLSVLFEIVGFGDIDIRRLHPHEKLEYFQSKSGFDPELAGLLFGPQDLTIMGTKPMASGS